MATKDATVRITITLAKSLRRWCATSARERHQSMSAFIAQQLREGVERLEAERAK